MPLLGGRSVAIVDVAILVFLGGELCYYGQGGIAPIQNGLPVVLPVVPSNSVDFEVAMGELVRMGLVVQSKRKSDQMTKPKHPKIKSSKFKDSIPAIFPSISPHGLGIVL